MKFSDLFIVPQVTVLVPIQTINYRDNSGTCVITIMTMKMKILSV